MSIVKYITFLDDDDCYTDYGFYAKAARILDEHERDDVHSGGA